MAIEATDRLGAAGVRSAYPQMPVAVRSRRSSTHSQSMRCIGLVGIARQAMPCRPGLDRLPHPGQARNW